MKSSLVFMEQRRLVVHNLGTVIKFELVRTLKKPAFWISVFAIPILIGVIGGIVAFAQISGSESQAEINKKPFSFSIMDETGLVSDQTLAKIGVTRSADKKSGIESVSSGKKDAFFYYPKNVTTAPIEVYNKNDGLLSNDKYSATAKELLVSSTAELIGSKEIISITKGNVTTTQKSFKDGKEVNLIGSMIAPAAALVIFYAIIVMLGNQMLASTTEEKENRVTEMLLTSLQSKTLIIGKIIALVLLGFIQIAAILVPIILGYIFAREMLNIPDISNFTSLIVFDFWPIFIGAGLLISGFLLFTGLLVGIGAAAPTAKDANSFFGIVILMMFIPFYFFQVFMVPTSSPIVLFLSYFPLTAPVTLMIRNIFGTVSIDEALIGLVIVSVCGVIAMNLAVRIFRYGTLEYSKRLSLKSVIKIKKRQK